MSFLSVNQLSKSFGNFNAVDHVSFEIERGEFVCFLGPSGCGKTTLLRMIAGLELQDEGTIIQNGIDISRLPVSQRDFGIVFQSYALFPNLNVSENIEYGLKNAKVKKAERRARVTELVALMDLHEHVDKYPQQLSGGQQQRVALARALALKPSLLLLDEPLSALDAKVRTRLRSELKQLQKRLGITTIMVTHDQEEALSMADKVVVMNQGRIEQCASPNLVYRKPASEFVADFVGSMNIFSLEAGRESQATRDLQTHLDLHSTSASLAIRPEHLVLEGDVEFHLASEKGVVVSARVEAIEYFGRFVSIQLVCDAWDKSLEIDLPSTKLQFFDLSLGAQHKVALPKEALHVFSQDAETA
ncbi:MAG: putative 2-aminoethylphosphonate ABC transporter ATP-binding protein [Oleiphilaceae bacterium]|nr:putative 2-aminoethylphosphonate ABC transporter ATP-binding protein [Oleiphilaceae bacterium]